jgi:hypothetical protein
VRYSQLSFDAEVSRFNFRQGLCKDVVAASQTPFIVVTWTIIERVVCPNVLGIEKHAAAGCTVLSFLVEFVILRAHPDFKC